MLRVREEDEKSTFRFRWKAWCLTISVQAERKGKFDAKLPWSHGLQKDGLVLLYDNRRTKFPGKLHTRWMGPYRVVELFENGSLQLEDLQSNWLETRVNGSTVKKYRLDDTTEEEGDTRSERELPGIIKTGWRFDSSVRGEAHIWELGNVEVHFYSFVYGSVFHIFPWYYEDTLGY